MKNRSFALIALMGLAAGLALSGLLSQRALAQCSNPFGQPTDCKGDKQKKARPTPIPTPKPPAAVTDLQPNSAVCVPDQTQMLRLCAGLRPAGGTGGTSPADQVGKQPGQNGSPLSPVGSQFPWLPFGGSVLGGLLIGLLVPAIRKGFGGVSRLMEEEGIFYYFRHTDGHHTLSGADGGGPNPGGNPASDANGGGPDPGAKLGDKIEINPGPIQNAGSELAKLGDKIETNPGPVQKLERDPGPVQNPGSQFAKLGDKLERDPGPISDSNIGNPDL